MMPTIVYPSKLQQKILKNEAPGGTPAMLSVVVPSITQPSGPFDVHIAVLDKNGYPSVQCEARVSVAMPEQQVHDIDFRHGVPAVASLSGVQLLQQGLFRLSASCGELEAMSNPTLCTSDDVPGIYWGDPHVHTVLSNCHPEKCRSLNFCFTAARYVSGLDWVAAADHVSNGRCDFSKWKEQQTAANLYDDAAAFVTLPAYEASLKGGAGGDNNVYMSRFPDTFVDAYEDGDVKTLCDELADKLPRDEFFVVPHHTTRKKKHGEIPDEIYPGADTMPVIEVHSKWGTSEYRGNPNPLKEIHDGPSYATDLLNRGLKLGFIAGTDTHATMPSGGGQEPGHIDRLPGLTAVRCREFARRTVFDALRHRQCYAASHERILMHGSIAGRAFGETLQLTDLTTPPKIDILVAGKSHIVRVDLVRNGETIHTVFPGCWSTHVIYEDDSELEDVWIASKHQKHFIYYYVRVTCESDAQAWSSPVWILN
jgi:hypothetical protein